MPKDYESINNDILNMAVQFLVEEKTFSVKLVATRCIIKYTRKLKPDLIAQRHD
jgi:hypothetical protein